MNSTKGEFQLQNEVEKCIVCHGQIYMGEVYYRIGGEGIHRECLEEFAKEYFMEFRNVKEEK
ncbi:MAG: hypothetical protein GX299_02935 [Epulopiscium sp.]|nr:hypothetical protein [Candidatus Epulonipiscium sp.]